MAEGYFNKQYLVVDDFADMRAAIRSILRSLGISHVDQARDGKDAIARMDQTRYDVVMCDYNLGAGKDGQQVLEEARLRQLIQLDGIFIMITAENTREMVMGAAEYAPDSYLAKPFTKELLKQRLDKVFERKAYLAGVNKALIAKDYAGAIARLSELIADSPRNLADLLKLKTDICLMACRYDEALAICEQILGTREIAWARLGLGKALYGKKRYAQAQDIFTQLIASEPDLIDAHDWLAKTQTAQQQFEEAENTLQAATRLSPRGLKRYQLLGNLALNNGHPAAAEAAFGHAVSLARHSVLNHPSLFAGMARAKASNHKPVEALKMIGEIGKVFPDHPEAAFYKATATAVVKQHQGDPEGALEALQIAEQIMAERGNSPHSKLGLEMAKTYVQLGEQGKLASLLKASIANNHDDEEFLTEIVQLCREAGQDYDAEQAIREIQQEIVKTNNAGVRLIKQGEFDAAIELLHEAAEEMPANKTINLNAAMASIVKMEKMGTTGEDIQCVRQYIGRVHVLDPHDWRLGDVIARLRKLAPKV
ncbi:tetratricopeptide repeat-containing response regulator [Thiocystis violascens]|uniref:Response regulator with CheY-like receiver, AAA-type ATPase, and DNA-binding domains n=1 Tax=Thiocystis violascens (strain ATCC 17096 / DSM 198 / 6111) TaxID=765911 RepID=I3Y828_THIV6|nr:tetratricopeptide repeat-containing response regulator [Thiocystis violascens]AFL73146.1 response regulator with CheY-like receiver, AAA-type ATPase, and DNA-binding domains [Thiocystis violascens DSM 198]